MDERLMSEGEKGDELSRERDSWTLCLREILEVKKERVNGKGFC